MVNDVLSFSKVIGNGIIRKTVFKTKDVKEFLLRDPLELYKNEKDLLNKEFFFKGHNNQAILLIHGWSTVPYEMKRLGEFLNAHGYTVYIPMLSGHGTVPQDMENVTAKEWIKDVVIAYKYLYKKYGKVYVGGTSMGATLALNLATQEKKIAGLILMAAPYKLKMENLVEKSVRILSKFKKYHRKFYPPTFGKATSVTRLISYQTYSLKSVIELGRLVQDTRLKIEQVKQPCLLLQSKHDHIIQKRSMNIIYNKLGSKIKRKRYIDKAYHTFISDTRKEYIFEDILDFIKSV